MAKGPLNFGDDEEAQSLIREAAGGLASAANNSTRTVIIQEKSSAVGVWKVLTMVLIGIVFLFATDSIEIKHASKGGKVEDIGAKVEKKVPHKAPNTGTQTTPNTGTTPKTTTYTQKQQKSQEDEVLEEVINDQEEVEEEMDELEEDLKGLEKEEKDIEQQIETLEETKDELETIEFEKIELEHTIDAIGEELQDTIEKEEELELVIAEEDTLTEEDKAEVEKEKEELDEKLDELEGELEDAQADEEELEKIDEAKEKIDKKIEEEEEELEAVEKEKEEVKEELNEVEEEKKELEAMVEVLDPNAADSSVSKSQSETPENPQGNENEEKTNKLDHGLDFTPGQDAGIRHTYSRRGQPMTDKEKNDIKKKWGSWTLVDEKERPTEDFYKEYLNRDIPRSKFPNDAWQIDKDYLAKFLPEGIALVQRAQDAILAEYGQPEKGEWEERAKMFHVEQFDELAGQKRLDKHESTNQGGWTTKKSWEGLKRRILHAVMTEDMFVFAMGGHSAAAGHG